MTERNDLQKATQPDLPGFSPTVQALTSEQRARVVERALEKNITDTAALAEIEQEDREDARSDRARFHAP